MRSLASGDMADGYRTRPSQILFVLGREVVKMEVNILLVDLQGILVPERGLADEEFVDENAKCPPIYCCAMTSVPDHFGRQVFRSTAKSVRFAVPYLLCKAKVYQLQVTLRIDEDVLRLEISVCDALPLVQKLQHQHNLRGIELGRGFVEASGATQIGKDLASRTVIQQHVERIVVLEACNHGRDKGMPGD